MMYNKLTFASFCIRLKRNKYIRLDFKLYTFNNDLNGYGTYLYIFFLYYISTIDEINSITNFQ